LSSWISSVGIQGSAISFAFSQLVQPSHICIEKYLKLNNYIYIYIYIIYYYYYYYYYYFVENTGHKCTVNNYFALHGPYP
jgi:hypothetical protein